MSTRNYIDPYEGGTEAAAQGVTTISVRPMSCDHTTITAGTGAASGRVPKSENKNRNSIRSGMVLVRYEKPHSDAMFNTAMLSGSTSQFYIGQSTNGLDESTAPIVFGEVSDLDRGLTILPVGVAMDHWMPGGAGVPTIAAAISGRRTIHANLHAIREGDIVGVRLPTDDEAKQMATPDSMGVPGLVLPVIEAVKPFGSGWKLGASQTTDRDNIHDLLRNAGAGLGGIRNDTNSVNQALEGFYQLSRQIHAILGSKILGVAMTSAEPGRAFDIQLTFGRGL